MVLEVIYYLLLAINAFFILVAAYYIIRSRNAKEEKRNATIFPSVAIAVPTYNQNAETLEVVLESLKGITYPKDKLSFCLLDDSDNENMKEKNEALCESAGFVRIPGEGKSKAAALNSFIAGCNQELIAIFDSDEVLIDRNFLAETVGYFEDEKVAIVQTRKDCTARNILEKAASTTNNIFFNIVQAVEGRKGNIVFSGSCAVLRKKALADAGGFPDILIEDVAISLLLPLHGWRGVFVNRLYALGTAPESYAKFARQQKKYIRGVAQLMIFLAPRMVKMRFSDLVRSLTHSSGLIYASLFQLAAIAVITYMAFLPHSAFLVNSAFLFFILPFIATLVLAKIHRESVSAVGLSYALNLSLVFNRSSELFYELLRVKDGDVSLLVNSLLVALFACLALFAPMDAKALMAFFALVFLSSLFFRTIYK
jgi:cellulose synthase (UDP-forming)